MALQLKTVSLSELRQMKLRHSDVLEIEATSGVDPADVLEMSIGVSDWWYALVDPVDGIVAVFGVAPSRLGGPLQGIGCPWLLASDAFYKHKHAVCRLAKKLLKRMHETYPVLFQLVDTRHEAAVEWVLWLGFEVVHVTEGRNGETLIQVVRRNGEHHV